jgi:uncharacterized protein (TIGR02996 family)
VRVFERDGERVEIDVVEDRVVVRRIRGTATDETDETASSEAMAKWAADRLAAEYAAQGFTRADGGPAAASHDELIDQLARDPDDLDTYLVLADWLSERGDPWGRVIAVQTALARLQRPTDRAAWREVEARRDELARGDALLLFQHAGRLWGPLGDTIVDGHTQRYGFDALRPQWHCGFVRAVSLHNRDLDHLAAFAELDIARLLQSIEISVWTDDTLAPLVAARWPQLRRLAFDLWSDDDGGALDGASVAPMLDGVRAPLLAELAVSRSRNTDALCRALAGPQASRLRSIALHGSQLTDQGIAALSGTAFDALENLVITGVGPWRAQDQLRGKAKRVRVTLGDEPRDDDA